MAVKNKTGAKSRLEDTEEVRTLVRQLGYQGLLQKEVWGYFAIGHSCWFKTIKEKPEIAKAYWKGRAQGVAFASGKLMEHVKKGTLKAIIFYLTRRGGFLENVSDEDVSESPEKSMTVSVKGMSSTEAAKIYQTIMTGS